MDFIIKLPKSKDLTIGIKYNGIFNIVERFIKFAKFIPFKETYKAKDFTYLFLDHIVKNHGLPEELISNRDKLFTLKFWTSLIGRLKAKHRLSTVYHPKTNGQIERINQMLE